MRATPELPRLPEIRFYLPQPGADTSRAGTETEKSRALDYPGGMKLIPVDKRTIPSGDGNFFGNVISVVTSEGTIVAADSVIDMGRNRLALGVSLGSREFLYDPLQDPAVSLIPVGISELRRGNSVIGIIRAGAIDRPPIETGGLHTRAIEVFTQPLPKLESKQEAELRTRYKKRLAKLIDDRRVMASAEHEYRWYTEHQTPHAKPGDQLQRFGSLDERILYDGLKKFNPDAPNSKELQALFPNRYDALQEGYVQMELLTLEYLLKQQQASESHVPPLRDFGSRIHLPALQTLYRAAHVQKAGFTLKLAEAETIVTSEDRDEPYYEVLAVMAKPAEA